MEQTACIQHPGSDTLPTTVDGRSEVGCKSLKCRPWPALCLALMQGMADPQHLRAVELMSKTVQKCFCSRDPGMATAAPSPPPPLQQKDANAISPSELSPPCSTGLVPTPVVSGKAKQVAAKIATAAAALVDASAAVLSERKCGGAGGI